MAKVGTKKVTAVRRQLNGLSVAGQGTMEMPTKSPSSTPESLDGVHTTRPVKASLPRTWQHVPVLGIDRKPLMPTTPWRAEKWIKSGKATPYWSHGVFCVRLNVEAGKEVQIIAVGIDPGSKKEGFTVKSEEYTFLNIQADAVTWVSREMETRRVMRRSRRQRKTPCRSPRSNRKRGGLAPSSKARQQFRLHVAEWLCKLFPVDCFVVEDVKAVSKGKRVWDKLFSNLQDGKNWFYAELGKFAGVETKQGHETEFLRIQYGLKKGSNKLKSTFSSHCVDSWALASYYVGGSRTPDNEVLLRVIPLRFHRRRLHMLQSAKGGKRRRSGSTRSLGFKRGSLVKTLEYGKVYIGGTIRGKISLHSIETGVRVSQVAKKENCKFLAFNSWRTVFIQQD